MIKKINTMRFPSRLSQSSRYITFLVLLFSIYILQGCGSRAPQVRYYMLDYVPTPDPATIEKGNLPYSLRIKTLNISEAYRRPEIVYRQSAHELLFYNFHKWAVKPEHLVSDMVFKHIRESHLFRGVTNSLADFEGDYALSGEILAIEEYDSKDKWYAHMAISFTLEDNAKRKQVWQKTYDFRKSIAQEEPVYVIRELSYLLEYITTQLCRDLDTYIRAQQTLAPPTTTTTPQITILPNTTKPIASDSIEPTPPRKSNSMDSNQKPGAIEEMP